MEIVWSARAKRELKHIVEYIDYMFGRTYSNDFYDGLEHWTKQLEKYPEIGFPEPLLKEKKILYRSVIFSKHNKLIYYVCNGIIRIVDVWDMRRSPETLQRRITTKAKQNN